MRRIFIILVTAIIFQANAQSLSDVISEINKGNLESRKFSVNLSYKLYTGNNHKPIETKKGILLVDNENSYSRVGELEMVNTRQFFAKINNNERAMLLTAPKKTQKTPFSIDLSNIKDQADAILIDAKDDWKIVIKAQEFSQFPYEKIELYYNKKTFLLQKQVFYFLNQIEYNSQENRSEIKSRRLTIEYKHYKFSDVEFPASIFRNTSYFTTSNNQLIASGKYRGFEIIDLRQK